MTRAPSLHARETNSSVDRSRSFHRVRSQSFLSSRLHPHSSLRVSAYLTVSAQEDRAWQVHPPRHCLMPLAIPSPQAPTRGLLLLSSVYPGVPLVTWANVGDRVANLRPIPKYPISPRRRTPAPTILRNPIYTEATPVFPVCSSFSFCSSAAADDALAIGSVAARHCGGSAGCHRRPPPADTGGVRKRSPLSRSGRS